MWGVLGRYLAGWFNLVEVGEPLAFIGGLPQPILLGSDSHNTNARWKWCTAGNNIFGRIFGRNYLGWLSVFPNSKMVGVRG